jgi:cell division protein FtsQ
MRYSEADRKRRGKRRKKHHFLNIVIMILVILGLYYIGFHSDIFSVKEITVEDNVHYTTAQIKELTGLAMGENIFMVRVSEVSQRLEQDPYIRSASVSWVLPDGLKIVVDERTESVLIEYEGGYAIVDFDGVILRSTQEQLIMPIISGLTPIDPRPGVAMKAEEAGLLKPALDFIKFIGENDFYIKRLVVGGVIPRAYIFDRLILEGELQNIENNFYQIKRIVADLDSKGIERGTISVTSGACSFSPEIRD